KARFLPSNLRSVTLLQLDIFSVPASKQASVPKKINAVFDHDAGRGTAVYLPVHEDSSTASTKQFAATIGFRKKSNVFTVVLDPGHGGKDPGAEGKNGQKEKNIVLAIAKKLARAINGQANMRAILTRKNDVYLPLRERLKRAREAHA